MTEARSLDRLIRSRRMTRTFADRPVVPVRIDEILDLARRAPSAGNTAATEFLVLDRPADVAAYWDTTMTPEGQAAFRWQGLLRAPVLVVLLTSPEAYVRRYAETDKARPGLGDSEDAWPQPFWWVDAGAVAQNLLLACVDRDLGACLFGVFDHEVDVRRRFSIPEDRRIVCTIAIGHPPDDPSVEEPGRSAGRRRPPLTQVVRRGSWNRDDPGDF